MNGLSAVIFVPDDTARFGYPQPLMLHSVLGAPLLAWLADALFASGVGRFFLVCHDSYMAQARACLPREVEIMTSADSNPADQLHVFLSTADEGEQEVTVITGPTLFLPSLKRPGGTRAASACRVYRETLMTALDEQVSLSHFLRENCAILSDNEGFYSVDSPAAALDMAKLLHRDQMLRLSKQGIEIFDTENCYVAPTVRMEERVKLLPGTILRGDTVVRCDAVIGPWTTVEDSEIGERSAVNASQVYASKIAADVSIGPYAHIREGSVFARGVRVGSFVETKNAVLGENTWASHLSYVGDAEVGARCNLGCGTATVNFDRVNKHKTTIGDDAFIGCHTALIAPITVGNGAYIGAGSTITDDVPEQALGIARSRQSNKKDWAARHKK